MSELNIQEGHIVACSLNMLEILIAWIAIKLRLIRYLDSHFYVTFLESPLWWQVTQRCDSELLQFRPLRAISAVRTCSTHVSANIHDASLPYCATFCHHSIHAYTLGLLLSCTEVISPTECDSGIIQKLPFEGHTTTGLKNIITTNTSGKVRVKHPRYRAWVAQRVPGCRDPQISWQRNRMVVRLSALRTGRLYPQEIHLLHISIRGLVDPRAIVWPEGLCFAVAYRGEGVGGFKPLPEIPKFYKVEPDCKLSGKCLMFLFQHPN
jgi:hypothetical protein